MMACLDFNPRSLAGATKRLHNDVLVAQISIHAPSRERPFDLLDAKIDNDFNPRSLAGATQKVLQFFRHRRFQSTLPRGSDEYNRLRSNVLDISIHAPSRERPTTEKRKEQPNIFQSTLPRGSDPQDIRPGFDRLEISIHAPSRERPIKTAARLMQKSISIHAPSRERLFCHITSNVGTDFNPRSLAGATNFWQQVFNSKDISIHAPSRERLSSVPFVLAHLEHFNPRSLAGATTISHFIVVYRHYFNPRSLAGATALLCLIVLMVLFQSTLPRGSDINALLYSAFSRNFNPRSLAGATNLTSKRK